MHHLEILHEKWENHLHRIFFLMNTHKTIKIKVCFHCNHLKMGWRISCLVVGFFLSFVCFYFFPVHLFFILGLLASQKYHFNTASFPATSAQICPFQTTFCLLAKTARVFLLGQGNTFLPAAQSLSGELSPENLQKNNIYSASFL